MAKQSKKNEKGERGQRMVALVVTLVVMIPIIIVIIQNVRHSISVGFQIRDLNREARLYQKQIEEDSLLLEKIKFDEGLEEYARETFYMQRKGERVFIVE